MQYMSLSDLQRKLRINTENRFAVVVRIAARSELSNVAADKLLTFSGCPADYLSRNGPFPQLYGGSMLAGREHAPRSKPWEYIQHEKPSGKPTFPYRLADAGFH